MGPDIDQNTDDMCNDNIYPVSAPPNVVEHCSVILVCNTANTDHHANISTPRAHANPGKDMFAGSSNVSDIPGPECRCAANGTGISSFNPEISTITGSTVHRVSDRVDITP